MTPTRIGRSQDQTVKQARADLWADIAYGAAVAVICLGGLTLGAIRLIPGGPPMLPLFIFQILFMGALASWGWKFRDAFAD